LTESHRYAYLIEVLDVRRLRVLRELAARGTIAAAAEALYLTPPAVSQQLAKLERETGVELLRKEGRSVRLTEAARLLVAHSEVILAQIEAAEAELAATHGYGGELRIAAFPTTIHAWLPRLIAELTSSLPGSVIRVIEREPEDALSMVRVGDADLAIAHEYDRVPRRVIDGVERVGLIEEPMLLALAEHHPRADGPVRLRDLADETTWIVPPPPGVTCREQVLRTCAAAGFEPIVGSETYSYEATLALVAAGAIALVPQMALSLAPGGVRFLTPIDVSATRSIFAGVRQGSSRRPDIAAAVLALKNIAANETDPQLSAAQADATR
jgi:DNA-binding transcriptional LysR family regulator